MKYKFLRYTAYVLEILIFYVIQQFPNIGVGIRDIKPSLLIPIAIIISIFEGETTGIFFGVLCGLLMDFGLVGTLNVNTFVLPVVCYFSSLLCVNVVQTNLLTCTLMVGVVVLLVLGLNFLVSWLFVAKEISWNMFADKYALRFVYTWITVPFFYFFNKAFSLHIVEEQ